MIDIEKATKKELITEYKKCEEDWGKNSCDCYGYYIDAIYKRIVELGGWD